MAPVKLKYATRVRPIQLFLKNYQLEIIDHKLTQPHERKNQETGNGWLNSRQLRQEKVTREVAMGVLHQKNNGRRSDKILLPSKRRNMEEK